MAKLQNVPKMVGQNSRVSSPTLKLGKTFIRLHVRKKKCVFEVQPQRSPDLSPLECHLWGQFKTPEYLIPIANGQTHHQRIFNACQNIRNRPWTFESV